MTTTTFQNTLISIHDLPSRKYFEDSLLPLIKNKTPILDVGIREYNLRYSEILGISKNEYFTADIQLSKGIDKVDFLGDVSRPQFSFEILNKPLKFNSIIFMGVMGVGINFYYQIEMTFLNFNQILNNNGQIIVGWPEDPKQFLFYELGFKNYKCDDLSSGQIIPIIRNCGFKLEKIENEYVYRGNGNWDDEKKFQAYMLVTKDKDISRNIFMNKAKQYNLYRENNEFENYLK